MQQVTARRPGTRTPATGEAHDVPGKSRNTGEAARAQGNASGFAGRPATATGAPTAGGAYARSPVARRQQPVGPRVASGNDELMTTARRGSSGRVLRTRRTEVGSDGVPLSPAKPNEQGVGLRCRVSRASAPCASTQPIMRGDVFRGRDHRARPPKAMRCRPSLLASAE